MRREEIELHGQRVSYLIGGDEDAPDGVVLLVHGITGYADQWSRILPLLGPGTLAIAPDLIGHGQSAKPRGDYSLGAHASGLRDLLIALGQERATVVGHSLGGGIAMQFSYQFPERTERLVLVSSGGLGQDVSLLLRAATLPGSELVLPLLTSARARSAGTVARNALGRLGLGRALDLTEVGRGFGSLRDPEARNAFLQTLRSVVGPEGQRVSAVERLYLAAAIPSLVIWGGQDPIIPAHHASVAHEAMPGSRLAMLDYAGHFPQIEQPEAFAGILREFLTETEPAEIDADALRARVLAGAPPAD